MPALAAVLAVVALAAAGPGDAAVWRSWPALSKNSCFDASTCQHSIPGRPFAYAHCVVRWHDEPTPRRRLMLPSSVEEIDFAGSTIHKLYGCHMRGLEHIEEIHMDDVRLESVTSDALDALPDLRFLSVAHNLLTSLPEHVFLHNHRLHYLSLRDNPLRVSPGQPLVTSSSLQALDLADCNITAVDSATFKQLPSLRLLELMSNLLTDLPGEAVAPMTQLRHLYLQFNYLLFFPSAAIQELPQLEVVRLDYNMEMQGPLGPLKAPKLQRLTATGCSLQSVQPNLLATAPKLRYLEVADNQVHTLWLANESKDAWLVLLDMTGNPLECDCPLRDSFVWAKDHVNESRVFCGEPPRSWQDAELHNLNCNLTNGTEAGAVSGGGGSEAGAAVLWVAVSLVAVLAVVGGALLFVYRHEVSARFFSPKARAAASGGADVMPLKRDNAEDLAVGLPQEGGVAP